MVKKLLVIVLTLCVTIVTGCAAPMAAAAPAVPAVEMTLGYTVFAEVTIPALMYLSVELTDESVNTVVESNGCVADISKVGLGNPELMYISGSSTCFPEPDRKHVVEDGGSRVKNREDVNKAMSQQKPNLSDCLLRDDGSYMLTFSGMNYSSSTHPNREPYSGAWYIYNPNVSQNNLTMGGWRGTTPKYPDASRFTSVGVNGGRCPEVLQLVRNFIEKEAIANGW